MRGGRTRGYCPSNVKTKAEFSFYVCVCWGVPRCVLGCSCVLVKRHLMWPKDCTNTQVCISKKCSWHATDDSSIGYLCEVASANIPELISAFKRPNTFLQFSSVMSSWIFLLTMYYGKNHLYRSQIWAVLWTSTAIHKYAPTFSRLRSSTVPAGVISETVEPAGQTCPQVKTKTIMFSSLQWGARRAPS